MGSQLSLVQGLSSSQFLRAPPQRPAVHWSDSVQASLSLHPIPSVSFGYTQAPFAQLFRVQGLVSLQGNPAVAVQVPSVQALADEHGLPSSHVVPSMRSVNLHPVAGRQVSVVQGSLSLHVIAVPRHCPAPQTSFAVQASPSLHAAVLFTCAQPVAALQESLVHTLVSLQSSAVPAAQFPFWQDSSPLHRLLSAHEVPSWTGG